MSLRAHFLKPKFFFGGLVIILLAGLSQLKPDIGLTTNRATTPIPTFNTNYIPSNPDLDHSLVTPTIKQNSDSGVQPQSQPDQELIEISEELEGMETSTSPVEQTSTNTVLVTKIIDGDTIELETGQRVRYIGIDTPEITKGKKECYGQSAKAYNQDLILNKKITLIKDVSETDRYGRLLRYIYLDDVFVNEQLVKNGYAYAATFPPDVKFSNYFIQLENQARSLGLGLWGGCSSVDSITASSDIPQADQTDCPADEPIKGNAQSMIYHLPGVRYYNQTKPEECFANEQAAIDAGYRKSKI
ncbi:thermonuclease family protein [Candidatus Berkelbacteria bacterium]|nr:thermonuclease family protein [Candidatus Berkelbacteria bacterium]